MVAVLSRDKQSKRWECREANETLPPTSLLPKKNRSTGSAGNLLFAVQFRPGRKSPHVELPINYASTQAGAPAVESLPLQLGSDRLASDWQVNTPWGRALAMVHRSMGFQTQAIVHGTSLSDLRADEVSCLTRRQSLHLWTCSSHPCWPLRQWKKNCCQTAGQSIDQHIHPVFLQMLHSLEPHACHAALHKWICCRHITSRERRRTGALGPRICSLQSQSARPEIATDETQLHGKLRALVWQYERARTPLSAPARARAHLRHLSMAHDGTCHNESHCVPNPAPC